jgi:hypothetical protein
VMRTLNVGRLYSIVENYRREQAKYLRAGLLARSSVSPGSSDYRSAPNLAAILPTESVPTSADHTARVNPSNPPN